MLENISPSGDLSGLAKRKSRKFYFKAVHEPDVENYINDGWEFSKKLKTSIQLKKAIPHNVQLEDRVWLLFYKMKFAMLSNDGGAKLIINPKESKSPKTQIDVVAIDTEVALAIECKSSLELKRRSQFQEELGKFSQIKEGFSKSIRSQPLTSSIKRQTALIMVFNNVILNDNDKERAKKANVILFDEKDLSYYETLVAHIGPAAKYQILSDILPGKDIPGLVIKTPAIKSKMGGYNCYTFSISPEYLLKVSYVSHRSKGKASDINTYQRMLAKSRLKKIREYIENDGIFPTNIVLNFEKGKLSFQKTKQENDGEEDLDIGILGWPDIRPAYKSAWIIDGQHRLFSYSGIKEAVKGKLTVLAFEGLRPSMQAELFIDINAKQKSVKQSLLQELYAELHWDSEIPSIRISAIISKAIQDMNSDPECSLYRRIQSTDGQKDELRCITLTSLFSQIEKKGFFIAKEKGGSIIQYGPLWGGDDNHATLKRAMLVLTTWINAVAELNKDWWNIGAGEGGSLAMNDGISALTAVLRSVFEFLESKGCNLVTYGDKEICNLILPYAKHLGKYLASFDEMQRKAFRDLRGVAGVTYRTRQCQEGIRKEDHNFSPDGLDEWVKLQKVQTNKNAMDIIDKIEISLQDSIVEELQAQYGIPYDLWWYEGIPAPIRKRVSERMEEDKNKRGGKEFYFDLIDYKKIITENWDLFERTFAFGKVNASKDKRTDWVDLVNEIRKIVTHASSGKTVSIDDYNRLGEINTWLSQQLLAENEAI